MRSLLAIASLLVFVIAAPTVQAAWPNDGRPCGYTGDGHAIGDNVGRCMDNVQSVQDCTTPIVLRDCVDAAILLASELVDAVNCRLSGGC